MSKEAVDYQLKNQEIECDVMTIIGCDRWINVETGRLRAAALLINDNTGNNYSFSWFFLALSPKSVLFFPLDNDRSFSIHILQPDSLLLEYIYGVFQQDGGSILTFLLLDNC